MNFKTNAWAPPLLIVLGGFVLRLYRLGSQSLWYDESVSAVLARQSMPDLIAHTARDIHPPGYYLLLHLWVRLAGDSEFALAYFSLLFGLLLIAMAYAVAHHWFNRSVALWAASLIAFSPYNLWYSQEVRMYTLGAFLGLICTFFALQAAWERGKPAKARSYWSGYALGATLGLYCLYYFAFLLIVLNLYLVVVLWRHHINRSNNSLKPAAIRQGRNWFLANIAIIVLYLPWLGIAWRQATDPPVPPWRSHIPLSDIVAESWTALSFGESIEIFQIWPLLLMTLLLFGWGLWLVDQTRWRLLLLCLAFGPLLLIYLIPLLGLTTGPLYHVRYLFTYSPIFYIVLAVAGAWLGQRHRVLAGLVIILLAGGSIFSIAQFHTNPTYASDDLRGAVALLQQKWRPGDVILVNAGYAYTALDYYYDGPIQDFQRLSEFAAQSNSLAASHQPLILQAGTIDGPASLGWADPASDFYASSQAETEAALAEVSQAFSRIWVLRIYDTVTDPNGAIRDWLTGNLRLFEDQVFSGQANLRVQGYLSPHQPPPPPALLLHLENRFKLHGYLPPASHYQAGDTIYTAVWLEATTPAETPYALSLKLWDDNGVLAVQTEPDEWPVGNRFQTPAWPAGYQVRYPMQLTIPSTIEASQYWLNLVIYNTADGTPLRVNETGERVILLGGLRVESSP